MNGLKLIMHDRHFRKRRLVTIEILNEILEKRIDNGIIIRRCINHFMRTIVDERRTARVPDACIILYKKPLHVDDVVIDRRPRVRIFVKPSYSASRYNMTSFAAGSPFEMVAETAL